MHRKAVVHHAPIVCEKPSFKFCREGVWNCNTGKPSLFGAALHRGCCSTQGSKRATPVRIIGRTVPSGRADIASQWWSNHNVWLLVHKRTQALPCHASCSLGCCLPAPPPPAWQCQSVVFTPRHFPTCTQHAMSCLSLTFVAATCCHMSHHDPIAVKWVIKN